MTTYYEKLRTRLEEYQYKRGEHKGEAPMDKRTKSHFRVADRYDHMAVIFWKTDIIKAYADGRTVIDCDGWADRTTTKQHLNMALYFHPTIRPSISSRRCFSESQLVLTLPKGHYKYYDGIEFNEAGELLSEPRPFRAHRIDKNETAELHADLAEGGFKDMFRVLWGSVTPEEYIDREGHSWRFTRNKTDLVAMPSTYAHHWRSMVAFFAYEERYTFDKVTQTATKSYIKHDPAQTWANIMAFLKSGMYNTVDTEVYCISK